MSTLCYARGRINAMLWSAIAIFQRAIGGEDVSELCGREIEKTSFVPTRYDFHVYNPDHVRSYWGCPSVSATYRW